MEIQNPITQKPSILKPYKSKPSFFTYTYKKSVFDSMVCFWVKNQFIDNKTLEHIGIWYF
jgi:hypothetical protein